MARRVAEAREAEVVGRAVEDGAEAARLTVAKVEVDPAVEAAGWAGAEELEVAEPQAVEWVEEEGLQAAEAAGAPGA